MRWLGYLEEGLIMVLMAAMTLLSVGLMTGVGP